MSELAEVISRLDRIERKISSKSNWLNLTEAAEYARVSPATLRRWINTSKLTARRVNGGRLLIHHRDIDALLLLDTQKPTRPQKQVLNDYTA